MSWLLLRGLGRERRHWYEFPERLRELVAPEPVFLLDLAGMGTERERLPLPSVPWLARDVARRATQLASSAGQRNDNSWSLIGLSLGGMVALELCWLWGRSVARAIVINSSSNITSPVARLQPRALLGLASALITRDPLRRESRVLELTSALPASARRAYAERAAAWWRWRRPRAARFSVSCARRRALSHPARTAFQRGCAFSVRGEIAWSTLHVPGIWRGAMPHHFWNIRGPGTTSHSMIPPGFAGVLHDFHRRRLSPECHAIGSRVNRSRDGSAGSRPERLLLLPNVSGYALTSHGRHADPVRSTPCQV